MLINLVAGLVFVAPYVYRGLDTPDQKHWVPGFAMSGFVALATGLHILELAAPWQLQHRHRRSVSAVRHRILGDSIPWPFI